MKKNDACFLAFDTSLYTTSIAVASDGEIIYDKRIMLPVPNGKRGLRQSEAVFAHVKNLKQLFLDYEKNEYNIRAIAYSSKPCPRKDSYMPVFCVGEAFAISCAGILGMPAYALTHQHGHIYSAFIGNSIDDGKYCVFHVSGGTLEILKVSIRGIVERIEKIGGTLDITCGQLIDRIGVAAGLSFPAGRDMERIYKENGASLAVNVKELGANLSGAEAQALRLLKDGQDKASVCSGIIDCAAKTLIQLMKNAARQTGLKKYVFTGGVICNTIIREQIKKSCEDIGFDCILAQKEYSSDNACGLALAAEIIHNKGEYN